MDASSFIAKWRHATLTERSAAQQHFLDLCELVGHPKPAEIDPTGESFTFERGAQKHGGGDGWADVWKKGYFGWEYKGKHKNLDDAYDQLQRYRESLENPPLLVVCDMDRMIVHTNFTNTPKQRYVVLLDELGTPRGNEVLHAIFFAPEKLRPGVPSTAITTDAAQRIGDIAETLRKRGLDPRAVAQFLDRIVFCCFAEDINLLPAGLFSRLLEKTRRDPTRFEKLVSQLFDAMAHGGDFGVEEIRYFNGNLFTAGEVLPLTAEEITGLYRAAQLDWSRIDPSIFGTLFERGMDPARRAQLGAHYTSRADIETLVEPVVMTPLRREWAEVRAVVDNLLATGTKHPNGAAKPLTPAARKKARDEADLILHNFLNRLGRVTVLDPACGSGNFLYVTLQKLKDLEKEVIDFALDCQFSGFFPNVGPWQLHGLEINEYAHGLAQMTVWIGYLQWTLFHGYQITDHPVLRPMTSIQCRDAIIDLSHPDHPAEPAWPTVDYIVGNPPFLGDKLMRGQLGDAYVEQLRALYAERIPGQSDLCCYWFERARTEIAQGHCQRAGLLATQGIRGGANREVLKRIKETGDIFFAISDREWVLDGANVHVSLVGFDNGDEIEKSIDYNEVELIEANLSLEDISSVKPMIMNHGIGLIGIAQKAPFDVDFSSVIQMLTDPNPNNRPNSDVLRPMWNASDVTQCQRNNWNVDFGIDTPLITATQYQRPFEVVQKQVYELRINHREARQVKYWWLFARPCPEMRRALQGLDRYIVTPRVSKHRIFRWLTPEILCDSALVVFARSDDYFFGVLHSHLHEVWALKLGTRLETRPRYTPTTCFETFPFPMPTPEQTEAIAGAARELDRLRSAWLNPPEWTRVEVLAFPGAVDGPWARYVTEADARGIGTVRYPRVVPRDAACAALLAKRTLTNLYNERPAWLDAAHRALDAAVCAAYGWEAAISDDAMLARLLELNLRRSAGE